jgi:excisionase family DNA binding protein
MKIQTTIQPSVSSRLSIPAFVSVKKMSEILGCSRATVYNLISTNTFKASKIRSKLYIDVEQVATYMENQSNIARRQM